MCSTWFSIWAVDRMDSLIGLTVGNFQIIELIGRGGMSSVYLAADKELERSVALKIPHSRFIDSPDFVKRFRREAKAMARLRHPNIVQIYSVGSHGDLPFFAMEYVHGESLSKVIRRDGPLEPDAALTYISQIARAVNYAHKMDVIHRDIKPANILMESSGRVLVTDFGVSKVLSEETSQETMGFIGTPQYMSPEQCGEGVLDHRSDIYSLGAVFFEMLTGKPPFSGNSPAETIKKQLFDVPEFPDEFKNRIPERIQTIISKMLAKNPEERYPDIPAFLEEIASLTKENADPAFADSPAGEARGNGSQDARDFISHVNGHRTRWPTLAFASLVAVCAVVFSTSFVLSNGAGQRIEAMKHLLSKDEKPAASPAPEQPAKPIEGGLGMAHAITVQSEAEAAQKPQRANVQIGSKPAGAEVFLDSESRGTTPLTIPEVAPGKHMLAMKLEGYPDHSEEISADASNPPQVFHDFVAAKEALNPKGSISIDSEPPGAVVYIDGTKKGKTPLEVSELRPAGYTVALKLDGYENLQKEITLQPDESLRISLNLIEKPKFGALSIGSEPAGADVLLNGAFKGTTPLLLKRLEVGNYEVSLRKDGYESVKRKLVCKKDETSRFQATMTMTPQFAALQSVIAGDSHMNAGDFANAAAAYERAISLDPDTPAYLEKLRLAKNSLLVKQVQDMLVRFKAAFENENIELLTSMLDEGVPDFFKKQRSNAEKLFKEFDDLTVAFSDIKIHGRTDNEVFVDLHLSISGFFAQTGGSITLLDSDQTLTLRKKSEDMWKICAME